MSDATEELRQQLDAARRTIDDLQAKLENRETTYRLTTLELEENRSALLFMLEDLEAGRKKIEQAHWEWMAALDVVNDLIFLHDKQFRILRCNKAYQQCAGISFHEIIGRPYYEIFPKAGAPLPCCLRAMEKAEEEEEEEEVAVGDAIYRSRAFSIHDEQGVYLYSVHTLEDITERKKAEDAIKEGDEALRKSNERFDLAVRGANDGIWDWDIRTNVNYFSPRFLELLGYGPDEIEHELATFESFLHPEDCAWVFDRVRQHLEDNVPYNVEYRMRTKNGEYRWFQARGQAIRDPSGKPFRMAGSITDIAERRQAEAVLQASENKNRTLLENLPQKIFYKDVNSVYISCNKNYADDLRVKPDEIAGKTDYEFYPAELAEKYRADDKRLMELGKAEDIEEKYLRDGQEAWVHTVKTPIKDDSGNVIGILGIFWDITVQHEAEAAIQHANRALATLSAVNHTLVHASDENELLQAICQVVVEQHGYRKAWVGYVQHDAEKTIRPMAQSGFEAGYLDTLPLTWADNEYGQSPTGRAVRSGVTQISQNILLDPTYTAWREQALKQGFAASIALPLRNGSGVFGNLSIYAAEADAFDQAEIALLEEMAGDLAFGVNSLHIRRERDLAQDKIQQQLVQLQDSLEDTVRAIATIVEMRDPYTAGHQARVADLAAMLAKQIGLPEERVHAIHLAGIVHDLGKIQIPAEILSKPGKITDIEFSLIEIHPQAGYDILKGINFPWPIAQMVLQHHERLDGSGYPQGLKGEAILLEARILSVADVVEAMSSHRPYRPGLGIEAALEEIAKQRGIHFDPQVVDACLVLFREQHYSFK